MEDIAHRLYLEVYDPWNIMTSAICCAHKILITSALVLYLYVCLTVISSASAIGDWFYGG